MHLPLDLPELCSSSRKYGRILRETVRADGVTVTAPGARLLRPLMVMVMEGVTRVLVVVVGVAGLAVGGAAASATPTPTTTQGPAPIHVTGRCCGAGKGGGGCPGTSSAIFFAPPPVPEVEDVSWVTQDLHCPPTHSVVFYPLVTNGTNQLILTGEDEPQLVLLYHPHDLFPKTSGEYCVEAHDGAYRAAVCQPDPDKMCENALCIPKCCGAGEAIINFQCSPGPGNMSLQFHSFNGDPLQTPPGVVVVGDMMPKCGTGAGGFPSFREDSSQIHVLTSGKLLERDIEVTHEFNHYCIDDMYEDLDDGTSVHTPLFLICSEPESMSMVVKHYLQKVGYVISVVFLAVTILFHILIPALRETQGLCLVSHMVSMAVAYIFFFILAESSYGIPKGFCIFSGFVLEFSFLAIFFWLNVMCFDIWRVIRDTVKGIPLSSIISNDAKRFWLYSLYGWGGPLLVTVVAAIMHLLPDEHTKYITPPGFGKETCWLAPGDTEQLLYCYGYVAALFILDLAFLAHCIFMLLRAGNVLTCCKKEVSMISPNRKHLEAFWQRFNLFIVSVLCWTTEILSWKIPPKELWIVTDAVNATQGFLVFLIFISSKKRRNVVKNLLKKASLPCLRQTMETAPITMSGLTHYNANSSSASASGPNTVLSDVSSSNKSKDIESK